ncbi:vacuolar protein-sorting-associated protein 25-like [Artemia franciscana]
MEWPWQYNFPPFFTLQPNEDTRNKQLEAWRNLALEYCKANKQFILDINEAYSCPLFNNKSINRKLSEEGIRTVVESLRDRKAANWVDTQKSKFYVFWHTPEEWGNLIYNWANANGMMNSVCTFFELSQGEDTANEEFHNLDEGLLLLALKSLESKRKAEIIQLDEETQGVKFF